MNQVIRLFLIHLLTVAAHAQFYAPPVDFHDVAQRRFPVEAARVLAWLKRDEVPGITEIKYHAETDAAGGTVWKIEWFQGEAKSFREATVRYPEKALVTGPEWYRDVWKQLTGADWKLPETPGSELAGSFWSGAEGAGLARMTGVASALKQAAAPQLAAGDCARLAGTLVQAAQPSLGGVAYTVTLDGSLLARSAAWLCAAEQESAAPLDPAWATILIMAGRGADAVQAWGAGVPPEGSTAAVWHGWDLIIRMPPAAEALPLICRPENRLYAAPVFYAYNQADEVYGRNFVMLFEWLYRGRIPQLYDYAPTLNSSNRIKPPSEQHPILALRATLDNLARLNPWPGDAEKAVAEAKAVPDFQNKKRATFDPPSPELAALVSAGLLEDEGPLVPVAVATARDLLMFLYEGSGMQFATTYNGLASLGESPTARPCFRNWVKAFAGWSMFSWEREDGVRPAPPKISRFQYLGWRYVSQRLVEAPPADWPDVPDAFLRRKWLGVDVRGLEYLLVHDGNSAQFTDLLRRMIREGSQRGLGLALARGNRLTADIPDQRKWRYDDLIDELKLRDDLMAATPLNISAPLVLLKEKLDRQKDPLFYAQELERYHWKTGFESMPQSVFHQYVRANAITSARRFYERWAGSMTDRSGFAITLGEANFTLAVLQSDREWQKSAAIDLSDTFYKYHEVAAALQEDDIEEAQRQIDLFIQRAPASTYVAIYNRMTDFFPLIPALNNPKHPDHERALDAFPRRAWTLLPQWVLLAKAHLSPEDSVRFIAERGGEGERDLIVMALRGDVQGFAERYDREEGISPNFSYGWAPPEHYREGMRPILLAWLRNLLLKIPPPKEEPDLRPPGAEPLYPLLRRIAAEPMPVEPKKK